MDCDVKNSICQDINLDINGLNYAIKRWGNEDGIPVLAIHGWLDNANTFDKLAPLFPQLDICAIDLAGHGYTDHRHGWGQYSFYEYVYDVLEIAQALGWKQFNIMGHSMGAHIGLIAAGMEPEKVDKLFLIEGYGTPSRILPETVPKMARTAYRKTVGLRDRQAPRYSSFDDMVKARTSGFFQLSEEPAKILCQRSVKREADFFTWRYDPKLKYMSPSIPSQEDFCAFIKNVRADSSLIIADSGIPIEEGLLTERIACHENLTVKNMAGGHHLHLEEQYLEVAQALADLFQTQLHLNTATP